MYDKIRHALDVPDTFPGLAALTCDTMYLMGCRNFSQFCCTARSLEHPEQFCPFCQAELVRRGREPVAEVSRWLLLRNEFPHKATSQMWLIVPKRHVRHPSELTTPDWMDVGLLLDVCHGKGLESGGLVMRFGDPKYHVGTIEHLHFNVIEPKPGTEYRPPLAKNVSEHAEDYERLKGLKKELDEKGGIDWLFTVDGIVETQP